MADPAPVTHRPLSDVLPSLRPGLTLALRPREGQPPQHFLSDDASDRVFELGEREYFLCRRLDGRTPRAEALALYQERFKTPLPSSDLDGFVAQLRGEGFLVGAPPRAKTIPEIFNPEEFLPSRRLRLFRGDRAVAAIARRTGWLFGRPAAAVAAATVLLGFGLLIAKFWEVYDRIFDLWGPAFLLLVLIVSIIVVQTPRAVLQAVACKVRGGFVSEVGLVFIYYVVPEPYVKYSDLGWLDDKTKLLKTLATGIAWQILACALGIIGWFVTASGSVPNTVWLALAVAAGGGLVLVVGNPLVNVDGYRMLVTWLDVPNLRERALAAFGSFAARRPLPEPLTAKEKRGFLVFGLLVFIYAVAHLVVLTALAFNSLTGNFAGPGLAATVLLAAFMVQRPLGRWAMATSPWRFTADKLKQWRWRVGSTLAVVVVALLPYPYETGGPFTVFPALRSEVHCEIDGGRIDKVLVREGDLVVQGQALAQIDTREYQKNLEVTEASLDESQAKLSYLKKQLALLDNPPNIETIQELEASVRKLEALARDYKHDLDATTMRSPIAGRVITPLIEQTAGRYLKRGDLFATLEQADTVQVEILVPEEDAPEVKLGARVKVAAWAYPGTTFYGTVKSIAPIAATPALGPDVPKQNAVRVVAELPNADARFKSQITGFAKIKTRWFPVWWVFTHLVVRWFQVQFWYWIP